MSCKAPRVSPRREIRTRPYCQSPVRPSENASSLAALARIAPGKGSPCDGKPQAGGAGRDPQNREVYDFIAYPDQLASLLKDKAVRWLQQKPAFFSSE
jgi:hypothetical protein